MGLDLLNARALEGDRGSGSTRGRGGRGGGRGSGVAVASEARCARSPLVPDISETFGPSSVPRSLRPFLRPRRLGEARSTAPPPHPFMIPSFPAPPPFPSPFSCPRP
eukprot:1937228-Pyramimonas_sp.AAC.1